MLSGGGVGERLALIAGGALALALIQLLQAKCTAPSTSDEKQASRGTNGGGEGKSGTHDFREDIVAEVSRLCACTAIRIYVLFVVCFTLLVVHQTLQGIVRLIEMSIGIEQPLAILVEPS